MERDIDPGINLSQKRLLIGSLLGDGNISRTSDRSSRYSESHAPNQLLYLRKKYRLLRPFSRPIYVDFGKKRFPCYKLTTRSVPHFNEFLEVFYDPKRDGKLIPVDYLKENWHDDILAYWYLDDGSFDRRTGCYGISNNCPDADQLYDFLRFLNKYYDTRFVLYRYGSLYTVKIPLDFRSRFVGIVLSVATNDMLYKLSLQHLEEDDKTHRLKPRKGETKRIKDIRQKIAAGYAYEQLKKSYPITRALFKRLGGVSEKYITVNNLFAQEIVGSGVVSSSDNLKIDHDLILGSLLGDSNIFRYNGTTHVLSCAHCTSQASYLKLKYELLKPLVGRVLYSKNSTNDFFHYEMILKASLMLRDYYKLFYTESRSDKNHLQKHVMKEEIVDRMTHKALAFWIMDDGKKYGKRRYAFSISIGKQPYYSRDIFESFVGALNEKLNIDMRARIEKYSYEITTSAGTEEDVFDKIKRYIWPYFSYKFSALVEDCGSAYRNLPWFSEWGRDGKMYDLRIPSK